MKDRVLIFITNAAFMLFTFGVLMLGLPDIRIGLVMMAIGGAWISLFVIANFDRHRKGKSYGIGKLH